MVDFNVSEELLEYSEIDLESLEKKIGEIPDDVKEAIGLYNKALKDANNRNEDIALIALKKALAIYPSFYEAMNLMGLCYYSLGEPENARKTFNQIIQMEDNSIRASRYLDKLDGKTSPNTEGKGKIFRDKRRKAKEKLTPTRSWISDTFKPKESGVFIAKNLLGFILGVIVMCIIWAIVPGSPISIDLGGMFQRVEDQSPQIARLEKENLEQQDRIDEILEDLNYSKEIESKLREEIEQFSYWSAILRNLQNLADDGRYREVVLKIERDYAGLQKPDSISEEINQLNSFCKPKAVNQFYEAGRGLYKANANAQTPEKYQESAAEYLMAINIIEELDELPNNAVNIYYYGGKAIALSQYPSKEEAEEEAIRCFNKILEIAPKSETASYARSRINELQNGGKIKH